jgi:hypothetical protein
MTKTRTLLMTTAVAGCTLFSNAAMPSTALADPPKTPAAAVPGPSASGTPETAKDAPTGSATETDKSVVASEKATPAAKSEAKSTDIKTADKGSGGVHPIAFVSWGVTGALAIGTGITGVMALSRASDIKNVRYTQLPSGSPSTELTEKQDSAKSMATVSTILGVATVLGIGASLFFTFGLKTEKKEAYEPRLRVGLGSVGVEGSF